MYHVPGITPGIIPGTYAVIIIIYYNTEESSCTANPVILLINIKPCHLDLTIILRCTLCMTRIGYDLKLFDNLFRS